MKRLVFDLETNGLLDQLDRIHTLTIQDPDTGELWSHTNDHPDYPSIEDGLRHLAQADVLIGHNILNFDLPALEKVYPGWCGTPKVYRDTLVCTRLIWPDTYDQDAKLVARRGFPKYLQKSHSLKAWGLRLGVMKDDYSGGWDTWNQEMQDYGEQDVRVTTALWQLIESKNYSEQAIELEHQFAQIIEAQCNNGWPFDMDAAVTLQGKLADLRMELEDQLIETFGSWWQGTRQVSGATQSRTLNHFEDIVVPRVSEKTGKPLKPYIGPPKEHTEKGRVWYKIKRVTFNPSSREHIARVLQERFDWKPTEYTAKGSPVVDEDTLGGLSHIPEAKLLIDYLTLKKREGQLCEGRQAWIKLARKHPDGVYRIHGRVNTNGAVTGRCTHNSPNLTQVPGNGKPWGEECRSLFTNAMGAHVGADASGLELRCLAHYLGLFDGGNYRDILLEGDPHTTMQHAVGLETRSQAKTFAYAYLYGAGDVKLGSIMHPTATEDKQRKAGKAARKNAEANIPGLGDLVSAVKEKAQKSKSLIGLDRRIIPVRSPHSALNTLLQSAGAIVMKQATIHVHEATEALGWEHGIHWKQLGHIHDELQAETTTDRAEALGQTIVASIIKAGETLSFRCPLDGEYQIGTNWSHTH